MLQIMVIIGSGIGLVPHGTKPLPEPIMTRLQRHTHEDLCMKFQWIYNGFDHKKYKKITNDHISVLQSFIKNSWKQ